MSKEWNPVFPPQRRVSARRIRDLAELRGTHRLKILLGPPRRVGEVAPEVEKKHFNDRRSPLSIGAKISKAVQ
jgi:hypothetical protein